MPAEPARSGSRVFEGLTTREISFLNGLGEYLIDQEKSGFGGTTPFNENLAAKFHVEVLYLGANTCGKWCWDPIEHRFYCCG